MFYDILTHLVTVQECDRQTDGHRPRLIPRLLIASQSKKITILVTGLTRSYVCNVTLFCTIP